VSFTAKVLLALAAGIVVGLLLDPAVPAAARTIAVIEPVGTLFMNAIRMTVIPLVFGALVSGIASAADPAQLAKLGVRGVVTFLVLLFLSGAIGALIGPPILGMVSLDPAAAESLRASALPSAEVPNAARNAPTFSAWLTGLIPVNPIKAAVDGAMLPLIIFAVALGVALTRVREDLRRVVIGVFQALADAMLVLVRWILVLAPIGVFALVLPLVARLGVAALGALAIYVVVVVAATLIYMGLVLYPAAAIVGRVPLREFAKTAAPAQAVAFSARSSLAALPAMIDSSRQRLGFGPPMTGFFLPFASSLFRPGAAVGLTIGCIFLGRLYGVDLSGAQIATLVVTAVLTSFSIPGVPAGSIIAMVPVLASVGLPLEGLGILLGVDTIPDAFRTTTNVTGQLAAATIASRDDRAPGAATASTT
jgi:Na+/H+-dicarboxylate symporter